MKDFDDLRGRDVISADAIRVGRVHGVVTDPGSGEARYLEVELTTPLPRGTTGGEPRPQEIFPGELGSRSTLTDPDPTVAETSIQSHLNTGAEQHAGNHPGAVPIDRRDDSPDADERRVWVPIASVRVREDDGQVHLEGLRSQELASLPRPELLPRARQVKGRSGAPPRPLPPLLSTGTPRR